MPVAAVVPVLLPGTHGHYRGTGTAVMQRDVRHARAFHDVICMK